MTGRTPVGSSERQQYLVNEFAAQVVLAGDAPASQGEPNWLNTLKKLAEEAGAENQTSFAAEVSALQNKLLSLKVGSRAFFDAAEAGIESLGDSLNATGAPGTAATAESAGGIAQDAELISDFILESREHLRAIEQNVLAVEQDSSQMDPIHAMFRAFHPIKGIAGFLEFQSIRDVSHETETLLDLARNSKLTLAPAVIDVILESADYLSREVSRIEAGSGEASPPADDLIVRIRAVSGPAEPQVEQDLKFISEAVAAAEPVATAPGESPQPIPAQSNPGPADAAPALPGTKSGSARNSGGPMATSIKVDTGKLDFLVDAIGEMVIAQSLIRHNPDLTKTQSATLMRNVAQLSRITSEVQKTAMSMRMVPVGVVFQKMARLVRDLCRKSGKQAELVTYGDDTELDRNIVEELADPLMHMLRNALDHGIEMPDERVTNGKAAMAKVELRAAHHGGHILIEIADDGRGINREAVLRKATERGLVQPGASLTDSEVFALIFEPGFSTAEKVTDISGRGVGMDVVKKHIQKLRGVIETQSTAGKGTTFRLKLPLTLAIIDGLVVGVGQERYIVPIFTVKEMLRPAPGMVSTIENTREIALIRDRVLPVVRLHRRFSVVPSTEDPLESLLIIAESQETEFCLLVDRLIGKQEVVIKSLGNSLKDISGVAGGAILGDGRVALILEMDAIFNAARAA